MIALLAVAPSHQSANYVFTHFNMPGQHQLSILYNTQPACKTGTAGCSSCISIDVLCGSVHFAH